MHRETDDQTRRNRKAVDAVAVPSVVVKPRRIGLVGLGRRGWFHLERFRLRDDVQLVAVTDRLAERREAAKSAQWPVVDTVDALLATPQLEGVVLACPPEERGDLVERCLRAGLHVCLEPPIAENVLQARRLLSLADRCRRTLVLSPWQRWDPQFDAALTAVASGRLGSVRAVRLTIAEWSPWAGPNVPPGEVVPPPEEQFGPQGFDQLLTLAPVEPTSIWARRLSDEDGFLAVIDFADGAFAQIDFRRRTRTGDCSGWVLEGTQGSYRKGRIITVTPDGELVDEPVPAAVPVHDRDVLSWFDGARIGLAEPVSRRIWQAVALVRAVTWACWREGPVRWDEVVGS
jgi:predicted dehydrogenase